MSWFFWPWGMCDLSSLTRDQTCTLWIRRWRLNHWTAREVLRWRQKSVADSSLYCFSWFALHIWKIKYIFNIYTVYILWSYRLFLVIKFHYSLSCWCVISQFSSVTQSCLTLCDPMNRSTPGLPVHYQLLESTQTHVHRVGDAIQPSHPLLSPSPPVLNLSQHQGLFQWVSSSHQVTKVLEFQLQHQSFQWTPRTDLL